MDNEKRLDASIQFDCVECGASNEVYNCKNMGFKYIHSSPVAMWKCRGCGEMYETERFMFFETADN